MYIIIKLHFCNISLRRFLDVDARRFAQIRNGLALRRDLTVLLKNVIAGEIIVKILRYILIFLWK